MAMANKVYPRAGDTQTIYLKNVITNPNIEVGDYTIYNDFVNDPKEFQKNNVLYHYPINQDKLIIGKFCSIACGVKFIMGPANHRINSVTAYPFAVMGGAWTENAPPHLSQLPFKGDIVMGNDVWIGRESTVMPGVHLGDGCIVAAQSVVTKSFEPYSVIGGNPARLIKKRFDDELIGLLLKLRWWDLPPEEVTQLVPLLCSPELEQVKEELRRLLLEKQPEESL